MIPTSEFFGILAAVCLIPSLYRGAIQDLKEFKFSRKHFDSLWISAAILFMMCMYISLVTEREFVFAVTLFFVSAISSLIFGFIGFRYGGGGDWRALMYIAWIAPFMWINLIFVIPVCAVIQAVYWMARKDIATPPMFRKIPFAVSIFCGYVIALIWFIITVGS